MCSTESLGSDPNCSANKIPDTTTATTTSPPPRNPNRRSNKPIMEKRRRARINNCLNELKAILLEAMKKDPARHSKLEKADILELTVTHLKNLHKTTRTETSKNSENNKKKFCDGFTECASEVSRFLSGPKGNGINPLLSRKLMSHLTDSLSHITNSMVHVSPSSPSIQFPQLCHGPPNEQHHFNGISSPNPPTTFISLVPSRLSSGEIAFVVPNQNLMSSLSPPGPAYHFQHQNHNLHSPVEKPLELTLHSNCPVATSSPSSTTSSLSPASFHPYSYQYQPQNLSHQHFHAQQPLALVTQRRHEEQSQPMDMSCWRPW